MVNKEHKCNTCFYGESPRDMKPCTTCEEYNKYVNRNIYMQRPDTIEIKTWDASLDNENVFDGYYGGSEDYVQKANDAVHSPKHYMLFEKEGIEVRHVIEKLVAKIYAQPKGSPTPLFTSDYAQMMQYFMRFMEKNGKEDLEKGLWFLHRVLEAYE